MGGIQYFELIGRICGHRGGFMTLRVFIILIKFFLFFYKLSSSESFQQIQKNQIYSVISCCRIISLKAGSTDFHLLHDPSHRRSQIFQESVP